MTTPPQIRRYLENWQDEIESAYLYRALAKAEPQPSLAEVYRRLAQTEEDHARVWEDRLIEAGQRVPRREIGWRTRLLALFAKQFGAQFVLPTVNAMEQVDSHTYDQQPEARNTPLAREERSHARLLQTITSSSTTGLEGSVVAQMEGRHRSSTGGNTLRAAVLGANDGLLSNLSLIMGVAGANISERSILLTGFAGLLAGACSMALGEWLSVQSARELYERQIRIERQELEDAPEAEAEELALIYESKGLSAEQARTLADRIIRNPKTALDTLAREELGIDPEELGGSAWMAAITSFCLFAIGAIIPVIPFLFLRGWNAVVGSLCFSAIALFIIGAGITLLTGRSVLYSGTRQILFGFGAAAITYGVGRLIGVSIAG
ncbi:VIT1/CCC1 transporter family protein [Leptolyngbya sp. NIES-2104]|uniref:VIT1/CCC1 transporter family protein n=1 Tax=Leptolyngbya sp. NIES-2104 TaxID=1552121 RepID=UPI0006ECA880|nr:VIT1/CCC1 transporter family protein [Leptolyngbya sp. NIES-2104]GAP99537.1 putative membrane protein [Leptolyngbya sp. NIES-2104]